MGIISASLLGKRLRLDIDNPLSFVVTPLIESHIGTDSIDVRLGSHFLFPPLPAEEAIDVVNRGRSVKDFAVHVPLGGKLILPAHQTVLGATLEFIKLPYDVSGQILTKSSVARTFMVIETAPWIHPLYRGCLTLEIANVSNSALILTPGMQIGQLILMTIDEPKNPLKLSGSYIGPTRPESPLNKVPHKHTI
jgi:dCTP deaminase